MLIRSSNILSLAMVEMDQQMGLRELNRLVYPPRSVHVMEVVAKSVMSSNTDNVYIDIPLSECIVHIIYATFNEVLQENKPLKCYYLDVKVRYEHVCTYVTNQESYQFY